MSKKSSNFVTKILCIWYLKKYIMKLCNKFAAEFFGTAVLVLGGCGFAANGYGEFFGSARRCCFGRSLLQMPHVRR